VGLKRSEREHKFCVGLRSNRTTVGLKPEPVSDSALIAMQQSHHCGIETVQLVAVLSLGRAAIAPLWD